MATTRLGHCGIGARPYGAGAFSGKEAQSSIETLWQNARVLKRLESGDELTTARLPPGEWIILAKAQDTSLNYSSVAALTTISVENDNNLVFGEEQAPAWNGTLSGFVLHHVSGTLIPDSTALASAHTNAELFEDFVAYPVVASHFTALEYDIGADTSQLRVWSDIDAELGPGKSGVATTYFYLDYRLEADSFDGFETWEIGRANARRFRFRATILPQDGVAILTGFKPVVDTAPRMEKFKNQVIAPGGTVIEFGQRFINPPLISITPSSAALVPWWDGKTESQVTVYLHDTNNNDVGGVADVTAEEA